MLTVPTLEKLRELRLDGMVRGFEEQLSSAECHALTFEERLGLLVDRELTERNNRRVKTRRHRACLEGFKVFYARAPRLFGELEVARGDGRYVKLMNTIAKSHLLIIDDWGLSILTDKEQRELLEIIEDRNGKNSTIMSSQIPV